MVGWDRGWSFGVAGRICSGVDLRGVADVANRPECFDDSGMYDDAWIDGGAAL